MIYSSTSIKCVIYAFALLLIVLSPIPINAIAQTTAPTTFSGRIQSSTLSGIMSPNPASVPLSGEDAKTDTGTANTLLKLGISKYQSGDTDAAQELFKAALRIAPNNADVNFNLGAIAEEKLNWTGALNYYQSALSSQPGDSQLKAAVSQVNAKLDAQKHMFGGHTVGAADPNFLNGQPNKKHSGTTKRVVSRGVRMGIGIAVRGGICALCRL